MASHLSERHARLRCFLVLFAVVALATGAAPAAAAPPAVSPEPVVTGIPETPTYEPTLDRSEGAPGEHVTVTFPDDGTDVRIDDCKAGIRAPLTPCVNTPTGHAVDVVVPAIPPQHVKLAWEVSPAARYPLPVPKEGGIPFRVLEPAFDVALDRTNGFPGEQVTVRFASRATSVSITDCQAWMDAGPSKCRFSDGKWTAEVTVPEAIGQATVSWTLTYAFGIEGNGATKGNLPFRVIPEVSESPPPPPGFHVVADPDTAGPGQPVAVRFSSETDGVVVDSCSAGFGTPAPCDGSDSVVVLVPADARVGTTIALDWQLTYSNTRLRQLSGVQSGRIDFPVMVDKPIFAVAVEPSAAAPGQPVVVSVESLVPGIEIVDCLVFFPNDAGSECQRSPDRWFARTRVPPVAAAGMTLLRWGLSARTSRGDPRAANGVIDYEVLRPSGPPPVSSSSDSRTATATDTATASETATATDTATASETATTEPATTTPQTTDSTTSPPATAPPTGGSGNGSVPDVQLGPVPQFVVVTQPESTRPGGSVRVTVDPADPGVEITTCLVAFAGQHGSECRPSGNRWAATVTVPNDAQPGDLPLRWGVASRTTATGKAGADNGLIDYRVLGNEPVPPAFSIRPDPAGAPPGQQVAVVQTSLVDDVSITGCSAGFDQSAMSPCRQSADRWLADVVVPPTMHAGPSTVRWRLTYARDQGGPGATDGLVTFTVLAAPAQAGGHGWWDYLWRVLLGTLVVAGLVGYRKVGRLLRKWRRPVEDHDRDDTAPVPIRVSARQRLDRIAVAVSHPDPRPVWRVRITVHEPDPDPVIHEEAP